MPNIFSKKSLGQNWLNSEGALATIIEASQLQKDQQVVEVGPGQGALTEKILKTGAKVIAVEKDHRLIGFLAEKFAPEVADSKLKIIEGDILELKIKDLVGGESYKVIANIPYYITGVLIRKFLEESPQPRSMTILVQKEVAERIVAGDGKESILSLSVKAYGEPSYVKTVKKGSFVPKPKVDSAILLIDDISDKFFTTRNITPENFFSIIKKAFGQKRKMLRSSLDLPEATFSNCNISPQARPEDLKLEEWARLVQGINYSKHQL